MDILKIINGRLLVIAIVFASYVFFALPDIHREDFTSRPHTLYSSLTAGFLKGHLNLAAVPLPALLKLPNPYDPNQNIKLREHDASLYHGKYYSYFGALPVFAFYMPFKLLTGLYAPDILAILFFVSIGFIFNFLLLAGIKESYFPAISERQLYFVGLVLGFANNSINLIFNPRFYEAAIASAYCLMSIAIFFLFKFFEEAKARYMWLFSLCLALSVAGRPHFALVCCCLVLLMSIYSVKYLPRTDQKKVLIALFVPMIIIASLLLSYNYLRFNSFFEFGRTFQLGIADYTHLPAIQTGFYSWIPYQIFTYFISPYVSQNPLYVPLYFWNKHPGYIYVKEFTVGALIIAPWILLAFLIPLLFLKKIRRAIPGSLLWLLSSLFLVSNIIFIFLLMISASAQRYESDYLSLFLLSAIVVSWLLQIHVTLQSKLRRIACGCFITIGVVSIIEGILSGLNTYQIEISYNIFSILTLDIYSLLPFIFILFYFVVRTLRLKERV